LEFDYLWTFYSGKGGIGDIAGSSSILAISADGTRQVCVSEDQTITVWNPSVPRRPGQPPTSLLGHAGRVTAAAISIDNKYVVSGGDDRQVKLWDAVTEQTLRTLIGHTGEIRSVAISTDGKWIVSGSADRTVKVWDVTTGQALITLEGHTGAVSSVAISPDRRRIVTGSTDQTLKVWDSETGQVLQTLAGHRGEVSSVAYTPNGKRIVSGSGDSTIKIWEAESGQALVTLKVHRAGVTCISIAQDGSRIFSLDCNGALKEWQIKAAPSDLTLNLLENTGPPVALRLDGNRVVNLLSDGTLQFWDRGKERGLMSFKLPPGDNQTALALSPDGKRVLLGEGTRAIIWDAEKGQVLHSLSRTGHAELSTGIGALSPDSERIITPSQNIVTVWRWRTGENQLTLKGSNNNDVRTLLFSPDGTHVACCTRWGEVTVWHAPPDRRGVNIRNNEEWQRWLSKGWDGEEGEGRLRYPMTTLVECSIVYSSDGRHIAFRGNGAFRPPGEIIVWDAKTGAILVSIKEDTSCLVFSPDGRRIFSGHGDGTVKEWSLRSGLVLRSIKRQTVAVCCLAVGPDGERIASAHADQSVRVWHAAYGEEFDSSRVR
jgi:WD40 repeat protein